MATPQNEWIIHDAESLRRALAGMKAKRKLSLEALFHLMGGRLLNRLLKGEQDNVRSDTLIKAVNSMQFELIIREPSTSKTQKRLAALKAEKEADRAKLLRDAAEEVVLGDAERDADGRLIRALTQAETEEVERLLETYSRF